MIDTPYAQLQRLGKHRLLAMLTDDTQTISQAVELVPILLVNAGIIAACLGYLGWLSLLLLGLTLSLIILGSLSFNWPQRRALTSISRARELKDQAACSFRDGRRQRRYAIDEGAGSISFGRCRHGLYYQHGEIDNITAMIRPEVLEQWELKLDPLLNKALACEHCFLDGHRSGEMSATAHMLGVAMDHGTAMPPAQPRSSLWLYGQSVTLVSLFLEVRQDAECTCRVSHTDRQRLVRARDRLLEDLAPSLSELARESGLSQPKLTRGFRQLFSNSVYGVFQQSRMIQARSRLMNGDDSVMRIASDLGYANASHFATAFRKQFGINPSTLKNGGRGKPFGASKGQKYLHSLE